MFIRASESNLLMFMEMRHHAGARVGVLVIDEQRNFAIDATRQSIQKSVLRTAAILGCPTWFAELGTNPISDTHQGLVRAAGYRSSADAFQGGYVLKKGQKTNVFEGSNLGAHLQSAGTEFLVVLGQMASCCVQHTIIGTQPKPPKPKGPAPTLGSPGKALPKPPSGTASNPLPDTPSPTPLKPAPFVRNNDAIRHKPLPPIPQKDPGPSTGQRLDAVSHCIVLTSPQLVNGDIPAGVRNHPKCYVFEAVGPEMWSEEFSQQMADRLRSNV